MGGATSKLKENVWEEADGKLCDPEDTIDGAPPTSKFEVFHLTKRQMNQREFDVTDSESNLLYTTQQVPGTIACFDVLGKEIDNYLLRIEVDVARRYWTIYRYEETSFDDQRPDKGATERLAAERLRKAEREPIVDNFKTPFLFRKACVIVSWSRYMAVATHYGPPSDEMLKEWENEILAAEQEQNVLENGVKKDGLIYTPSLDDQITEEDEAAESEEIIGSQSEEKDGPVEELNYKFSDEISLNHQTSDVTSGDESNDSMQDVEVDDNVVRLMSAQSLPDIAAAGESTQTDDTSGSPRLAKSESSASDSLARMRAASQARRAKFRQWAHQKSKHFSEKTRSALESSGIITKKARRDPMEGVLHLKKLLLCQEIYNRIIGNHQTSHISREKALELLQQDVAQHEKESPETAEQDEEQDAIMTGQEVILRTKSEDTGDGIPEEKSVDPDDEEEIGSSDIVDVDLNASAEPKMPESSHNDSDGVDLSKVDGEDEKGGEHETLEEGEDKEQPLVGYW
eukprot:CAMPEP_0172474660 /NCGR_PEP_ID=MMETSP1065-20121228/69470_1 /TAXON_ID=265537 /ORGANISM="Amphiprora paludosa, Strain CCMP125" /LENGTH=513 /DNA_ID=CAMNT_0013232847 /DNA_START=14 /DNA_END=1552 /DNA_ORIENTATION=+